MESTGCGLTVVLFIGLCVSGSAANVFDKKGQSQGKARSDDVNNNNQIINMISRGKHTVAPGDKQTRVWSKWSACKPKEAPGRWHCGPGLTTRKLCSPQKGCISQYKHCSVVCKQQKSNKLYFTSSSKDVSFYLHTKSITGSKYTLSNASLVPANVLKGTVRVLVHGWKGSESSWYCQEMVPEILKNKESPTSAVFVVDWKSLADDPLFFFSCEKTENVGKQLAKFIQVLESLGASRQRLHLIGFSLGGKVVSAAGQALTNPKIKRISGIDTPTGCFFLSCGANLNKKDAQFVDSLHNTLLSGFHNQGHVDFYPNGPKNCSSQIIHPAHLISRVTAAHERAVKYYIKSINQCDFQGRACKTWYHFPTECYKEYNKMGFHASKPLDTHENYYLKVPIKPPFCST